MIPSVKTSQHTACCLAADDARCAFDDPKPPATRDDKPGVCLRLVCDAPRALQATPLSSADNATLAS